MIKAKEAVNLTVLLLVLGAAFSLYMTTARPQASSQAPVFVYEEIKAQAVATRIAARPEAKAVPAPATPVAAPLPIDAPVIISEVLPEYPASALEKGVEGVALVQAYIGSSGNPEQVQIKTSSGNAELDASAVSAVSQWMFSPARQGNSAIASWFEVPVRFSIK